MEFFFREDKNEHWELRMCVFNNRLDLDSLSKITSFHEVPSETKRVACAE